MAYFVLSLPHDASAMEADVAEYLGIPDAVSGDPEVWADIILGAFTMSFGVGTIPSPPNVRVYDLDPVTDEMLSRATSISVRAVAIPGSYEQRRDESNADYMTRLMSMDGADVQLFGMRVDVTPYTVEQFRHLLQCLITGRARKNGFWNNQTLECACVVTNPFSKDISHESAPSSP